MSAYFDRKVKVTSRSQSFKYLCNQTGMLSDKWCSCMDFWRHSEIEESRSFKGQGHKAGL